jgi:LLM-partnered FMN reductase
MARRSLAIVTAGLSQPSSTRLLADRLTDATERFLRERAIQPEVTVLELRDHAQDLTNNLLTGFPSPRLRDSVGTVVAADGLIAVSPIFNASYSGLFKLFFDLLERDGLAGKPVLLAATGGTARHSLALEHALRPLFAYLNAATLRRLSSPPRKTGGNGRSTATMTWSAASNARRVSWHRRSPRLRVKLRAIHSLSRSGSTDCSAGNSEPRPQNDAAR